jgi:hypothetical protein
LLFHIVQQTISPPLHFPIKTFFFADLTRIDPNIREYSQWIYSWIGKWIFAQKFHNPNEYEFGFFQFEMNWIFEKSKKNAIRVEAIWIKRNSGASASQDELDQASFPLAHPGQFTSNLRGSFGNHIGNYAYMKVDTHRILIGSLAHIRSNDPGSWAHDTHTGLSYRLCLRIFYIWVFFGLGRSRLVVRRQTMPLGCASHR